ncbi:MAG: HAD-IA family hydrolase [Solirubrobacteraceae bacterium]
MIEAVICDFGGVLTTPLAGSFAKWSAQAGVAAEALGDALERVHRIDSLHPLHELECGRLTEADFFAKLEPHVGAPLDTFTDIYWSHIRPNTAMIDLMRLLRGQRSYRMALLTNNVREWEPRWMAMLPAAEIFELIIDSSAVGLRKPDPEIYALTLERLGLPGPRCLFIDDFAHNCEAAREAGMTTVHFVDNAQAIPEIEAALAA